MTSLVPCWLGAGLCQPAYRATNSTAFGRPQPGHPTPLTPELRGDIVMARKMFPEAIGFTSRRERTIPATKTGIAYHQLQDLNNAENITARTA